MSHGVNKSPYVYSFLILSMWLTFWYLGKYWTDSPHNMDFTMQCFSAGSFPSHGTVCTSEEHSVVLIQFTKCPQEILTIKMSPYHFQMPMGVGRGIERQATVLGGEPWDRSQKGNNPIILSAPRRNLGLGSKGLIFKLSFGLTAYSMLFACSSPGS